jgi:thiol:disulfide interchange protein
MHWIARFVCLLTLFAAVPAAGQLIGDPVRVDVQWDADRARAGDQRVLAVVIDLDDKWHINPDAARTHQGLIPTRVEAAVEGEGLSVGPVQFPEPKQVEVNYTGTPELLNAYEGRVVLYVPVIVAYDAAAGAATLNVRVTYQACDDVMCLPPRTVTFDPSIEIVPPDAVIDAPRTDTAIFGGFDATVFAAMLSGQTIVQAVRFDLFGLEFSLTPQGAGLVLLLLVAAFGGMLLNFTPCVLPVIPIKIMSLSHNAGSHTRCLALGAAMFAGVIAFWLAIGGAIAFVAGFGAISELFRHVWFTIGVGIIIAAMAVAMTGLFTIPLPRAVFQFSPRQDNLGGSFLVGVMTAILSTPCTAPFMGTAAAWATQQPRTTTLATFLAIGVGMALPYLVLSAMPQLVAKMPRTGPASELIKQCMGLLMLAAAAYFVGIGVASATAEAGEPTTLLYWWPVAFFVAAAGAWLAVRTIAITPAPGRRVAFGGIGAAVLAIAIYGGVRLTDRGPIDWVYYTPERFTAALADGRVVVLEFTAEWCLNCKAMEYAVLYTDRVAGLFDDPSVVPMKVDLTSDSNVAGWGKLAEVGRVAIPALVVFAPTGEEVFNSDFYTVEQVVGAVELARSTPALAQR